MAFLLAGVALAGLFMRPKNESKSLQEDMSDFVSNISQSFISNHTNEVSSATTQINEITIDNINATNCIINIRAKSFNSTMLTAELNATDISSLTSNLTAALSSNIAAIASQTSGWFSGPGNKSDATQRIINDITANITTNMVSTSYNNVFNSIHQANKINLGSLTLTCTPGHTYSDLDIETNAVVFVVADAISKSVVKQMSNSNSAWSSLDSMRTELQQTAQGPFSGNKLLYILIAVGVIMVIGLVIFLTIKYGGAGGAKKAPGKVSHRK